MRRARSQLTALQSGLGEVLGMERLRELAQITRLRRCWPEIVGPMLAARTEPVSLESGGLLVAVDHPVMAQELRLLQEQIRKVCFTKLDIGGFGHIRTRILAGAGIREEKKEVRARKLSLTEKKEIATEIRPVEDRTLRHAMFDARIAQIAYGEA